MGFKTKTFSFSFYFQNIFSEYVSGAPIMSKRIARSQEVCLRVRRQRPEAVQSSSKLQECDLVAVVEALHSHGLLLTTLASFSVLDSASDDTCLEFLCDLLALTFVGTVAPRIQTRRMERLSILTHGALLSVSLPGHGRRVGHLSPSSAEIRQDYPSQGMSQETQR